MTKIYYISKVTNEISENGKFWDTIQPLYISNYPWDKINYKPLVEVKLAYTDTELRVRFQVKESDIKIDCFHINDSVYKDSCVEFFFNPNPQNDKRYINFECNAAGVFLLQIGEGIENRYFISDYNEKFFKIKTTVNHNNINRYDKEYWQIEFSIPFSFLIKYYGNLEIESGYRMKGNFYKCGDGTKNPHHGCCYPIINEVPDFHKPEFFGELILV